MLFVELIILLIFSQLKPDSSKFVILFPLIITSIIDFVRVIMSESSQKLFRKISLNFVPYTTSAGSEGFKNFFQQYLSSLNSFLPEIRQTLNLPENMTYEEACSLLKGKYLIIDPNTSQIIEQISDSKSDQNNQVVKITEFDLLSWLQSFLDSRNTSNINKKEHSRGQRFPKPRPNKNTKGIQKNIESEFHLTPHTEFLDKKNIMIKFVSPEGVMRELSVNKDKKVSIFLKQNKTLYHFKLISILMVKKIF